MRSLIVALLLVAPPAAHAADPLLADIPLPSGYVLNPDPDIVDFTREVFDAGGQEMALEGRRVSFSAHLEPPTTAEVDALAQFVPAARASGWRVVDSTPYLVATKNIRGAESWLRGICFGPADCRFILIEKAARPTVLRLDPPKLGPVKMPGDNEDFPFLGRWPGSKLISAAPCPGIDATREGDTEPTWVGPGVMREYQPAKPISAWEFVSATREALEKAGWTILATATPSDGILIAHYAKNGRDVYIYLHVGSELSYQVVDVGAAAEAAKLAAELKARGHVALYGIYFDVDSAKLKPESEATLRQIVVLLTQDAGLKLEIQGHTDATGARPHNQTLSEQRAASVVAYLTQAGIAGGRLTAAGYADTKPVGDNDSPEGRAKNRRVELVRK
jgi:outer membrane protein OmpA-like peptidoglycan-associated protein